MTNDPEEHADAVVLSPITFDDLVEKAELIDSLKAIDRSMEDDKAGRVRPLQESMKSIAPQLGL
jgi:hypothetical protein